MEVTHVIAMHQKLRACSDDGHTRNCEASEIAHLLFDDWPLLSSSLKELSRIGVGQRLTFVELSLKGSSRFFVVRQLAVVELPFERIAA